jgi:hypothetical protein
MGNLGSFLTANLPYPGGVSTLGNPRFPAHTTPTNPNLNFQQPYYQTMSHGLNIPPWVRVFLTVLFLASFPLEHGPMQHLTHG